MYTQKMLNAWFKSHKTQFIFVIGYDGDLIHGYTDILVRGSDQYPSEDLMNSYMDSYKPLEVQGSMRRLVWCECFDKKGKVDLMALFNDGVFKYSYLNVDFEKE